MSESFQLYLDSKDAVFNNNEYQFYLPSLEVTDGFYLYFSVVHVSIPYSFYNINYQNNYFSYVVDEIEYNIVIEVGNYNINQLVTELKKQMVNFNIIYNSITNKIKFTNTLYDFRFNISKLLYLLGFTPNNLTSYDKSIYSANCINLNYIRCINLVSNICTYNISKSLRNNRSILASVQVNTQPYSIIQYTNNSYRSNLFKNRLDNIMVRLVDNDENIINLNGLNFHITIQLDIEAFR